MIVELDQFKDKGYRFKVYYPDLDIIADNKVKGTLNWHPKTRPIEVIPDGTETGFIMSDDPRLDKLKDNIARRLTKEFPPKFNDDGYTMNGISTDFGLIKTDSAPARQLVIPMCDNKPARAELGLHESYQTIAHKYIAKELIDCMMSHWMPGNVKVAKGSSSGFPFFMSSSAFKKEKWTEIRGNYDDILTKASDGKLVELFNDYKILFLYRQNIRIQCDGWVLDDEGNLKHSKIRPTSDLEYVVSSGSNGARFSVDKTCSRGSLVVLARTRTVYGLSHLTNAIQATFFEGYNRNIHDKYPETFVHHGIPDIERKLRFFSDSDPQIVCVDTANHDFLAPEFVLQSIFEKLEDDWDPRVAQFIRRCWCAPIYCMNPNVYDDPDPFLLGHPFVDSDFDRWYGIPSGTFLVTFAGKFGCMVSYLTNLHDIGIEVLGRVDEILRWQHPDVVIADLGDDAFVSFSNNTLKRSYEDYISSGGNKYYDVGVENKSFLGFLFNTNHNEDHYWATPNPASYIRGVLCPENGCNSSFRYFWAHGFIEKGYYYSRNPACKAIWEAVEEECEKVFGFKIHDAVIKHDHYTKRKLPVGNPTMIEAEVLFDPAKIYYKYDEDQVRPEILERYVSNITPEEYVPVVLPFFRGSEDFKLLSEKEKAEIDLDSKGNGIKNEERK